MEGKRNLRLVLEFDGTAYAGWQRQKGMPSIQQVLEDAVRVMTGEQGNAVGAGRTDAGVHALHFVAHMRTGTAIPCENLLRGLNSLLPPDVAVREVAEADEAFHARKHAVAKVYLYRICNRGIRPVVGRQYAWHVPRPLAVSAMRRAGASLIGTQDFTSFCSVHTTVPHRVRTITRISVTAEPEGMVHLEVEANGFLRHMVRVIAGTLVEVGLGKRRPEELRAILAARDRTRAGMTAPPQGLFLKAVHYGRAVHPSGSQGAGTEPPRRDVGRCASTGGKAVSARHVAEKPREEDPLARFPGEDVSHPADVDAAQGRLGGGRDADRN